MRAMASGRRFRPSTRSASSRDATLPVSTRIPRRPTRWAARTSASGSSPTIATDPAGTRRPRSARSPSSAWRKTTGDGLPRTVALRPVAYSSPTTAAPASSVAPRGVSHHGLRCIARNVGAAADQAERRVEIAIREVVAAVADDDRRDVRRAGLGLLARQQMLAVELPQRVRGRQDEQRPAGEARQRVGRGGRRRGDEPVGRDRRAALGESRGQRLPVCEREVRDHAVRDPARVEPLQRGTATRRSPRP